MRISEMLNAMASWLEDPNNEALLLSEYNDECLNVVAASCIEAAHLLKIAANRVDEIEPKEDSKITPESLEGLATIATAFDASNDPELKKQASVIDELLLTIAAPKNYLSEKKVAEDKKIDDIANKYKNYVNSELDDYSKIADVKKAIEDSGMTKEYRILEFPLSTRYCPEHPGTQVARIGEDTWQCEMDKKVYNFESGFDLYNGSKVPGGDVANQTDLTNVNTYSIFDSREGRIQSNK